MYAKIIDTGRTLDGKKVFGIDLRNDRGTSVRVFNYGAIINKFIVRKKDGVTQDIVLGFDTIDGYLSEDYLKQYAYFGTVIGRYANRISGAEFELNRRKYALARNAGSSCLHGGAYGFDKKVWDIKARGFNTVTLQYISDAGEEGFPGRLTVEIKFTLNPSNELVLDIVATTTDDTPVNLTHHSYFNLNALGGNIADHTHTMPASQFLEQDAGYNATGKRVAVANTAHDFREPKQIGKDWVPTEGYDQSFILDKPAGVLGLASRTLSPCRSLALEVYTTDPIVHFYTANNTIVNHGKQGRDYRPFEAFCVETQDITNGINTGHVGAILRAGQTYRSKTIYKVDI